MNDDARDRRDDWPTTGDHTYRARYAAGSDLPSIVVVEAVAALTDRGPRDLGPLHEALDSNVLDALLRPAVPGEHGGDGEYQ